MNISFTGIRKVAVLGALCTSLTLLAACSSDDDGDSGDTSPADDSVIAPSNEGETETPMVSESALGAELIDTWVLCSDGPGLRVEFEFDGANYSNSVGAGSCAGFESADQVLTNAGPYEITGTTTSETGLTVLTMDLTTMTINGDAIFESLIETRSRLAFVSGSDELFFSNDSREGQEPPTALNLNSPYVRTN